MTAVLVVSPTTPAPSTSVTVTGSGFTDIRTRLLLDGVVQGDTICSVPGGTFSRPITVGAAVGSETISAEQYIGGTWTSVATTTVTVTAPAGSGSYPAERASGFLSTSLPTVPARPSYLGSITDGYAGTQITRITNANEDRHAYSRHGPGGWNSDATRILLNFGTVANHIIDAATYSNLVSFSGGELLSMAVWSQTDPNKLFGVEGNAFKSQNATTKTKTTLHTFGSYTTISLGEYEGGISDDDKYVSLIGDISGTAHLITYRIDTDTVVADIAAPAGISDSQISPSGTYVTVGCSAGKRRYVQNLSSSIVLDSANNHADSAVDAAGADVLVCNNPSTGKVTSFRLSDGAATQLFGTTVTAYEYGHVGRARTRPGWIYLSVYDTVTTAGRRGVDQLIAVKLDGTGTINHFGYANNRTNGSTYAAQPHACASPDGSRLLFASPWGSTTGSIYAYISEMP